ncbi:unnamed protein product, partial [Ectocarpus sp. 6 AP-2014]
LGQEGLQVFNALHVLNLRRAQAESLASSPSSEARPAEHERERNECIVCMTDEVNCVLVPCGHHCICLTCASRLEECPICRRAVTQKIKTFSA